MTIDNARVFWFLITIIIGGASYYVQSMLDKVEEISNILKEVEINTATSAQINQVQDKRLDIIEDDHRKYLYPMRKNGTHKMAIPLIPMFMMPKGRQVNNHKGNRRFDDQCT